VTNETHLHRGMLYALAERRRTFRTYGHGFHQAYGRALKADPKPSLETEHVLMDFDSIFGTYRRAEDMILIGMRDLILTLDGSTYQRASFLVSAACAQKMMARDCAGHEERFRTMAEAFVSK
jgi:hypothetical protein